MNRTDDSLNRRKTIARLLVILVGLLLCFVGVFHDVVNIQSLHQAVTRGEIAERMAPQLIANVALAGAVARKIQQTAEDLRVSLSNATFFGTGSSFPAAAEGR